MVWVLDVSTDTGYVTSETLRDWGVSVPVKCHWACGNAPVLAWRENGYGTVAFACRTHAERVPDDFQLGEWIDLSKARHTCDANGKRVGFMDWPMFADPGQAVYLPEVDMYGRVRLVWHCCGAVLVEAMRDDSPECVDTYTMRCTRGELQPTPMGRSYSVPCVGAAWSLTLPCGHLNGEGCDCDTIEAEAAGQDGMVIETVRGKHEFAISADEADQLVSEYERDPWARVTRKWDGVSYVVSVTADGHSRANGLPLVSYAVPLLDV